ncbi:MAG: hypothetical protein P0S96_03510 [Simkaniaceae bacterium]|nr:hypothetical protein [Candidatus Sacchlamyda saccharinae]
MLCVDKPTKEEVHATLKEVVAVWKDKEAKAEEKEAALEGMSPAVREEMLDVYVAEKRGAQLGTKASAEKIAEWNTEHAQTVREGAEARLAARDVSLVDSMIALTASDA